MWCFGLDFRACTTFSMWGHLAGQLWQIPTWPPKFLAGYTGLRMKQKTISKRKLKPQTVITTSIGLEQKKYKTTTKSGPATLQNLTASFEC